MASEPPRLCGRDGGGPTGAHAATANVNINVARRIIVPAKSLSAGLVQVRVTATECAGSVAGLGGVVSPGDQATALMLPMPLVLLVHVVPSGDVTRAPELPAATNNVRPGDHATALSVLLVALVRLVHVVPSGEVLTLPPVPAATNSDRSGDHAIA